ncbi:MAG: cupin domain-containing protein [Alphaproteobacteria bacterium]
MDFVVTRASDAQFDAGLRRFFAYRDLGAAGASNGRFGAEVIRPAEGENTTGLWHYHKLDFQLVYVLRGWVKFEYEGQGAFTFTAGDSVVQPPEIHHRQTAHSDDLEMLEITSPAKFETLTVG